MNKIYFIYQMHFDETTHEQSNQQIAGPFATQLEVHRNLQELVRSGFDVDDLLVKGYDEDEYYYGKLAS